jgi:hypothetical protein
MSAIPPAEPPAGARDPNVIPPTAAKDPVLVLVLALFLGGIAYFVIGQWQKGLAGVAAWLCALALTFITCGVGIVFYLPLVVAIVIDAYLQAKCLTDGHPIGQWTFFSSHL